MNLNLCLELLITLLTMLINDYVIAEITVCYRPFSSNKTLFSELMGFWDIAESGTRESCRPGFSRN